MFCLQRWDILETFHAVCKSQQEYGLTLTYLQRKRILVFHNELVQVCDCSSPFVVSSIVFGEGKDGDHGDNAF